MEKFLIGDRGISFDIERGVWKIRHKNPSVFDIEKAITRICINGNWINLFQKIKKGSIKSIRGKNNIVIDEYKDDINFRLFITPLARNIPGIFLKLEIFNRSNKDIVLGPAHILEIEKSFVEKDTKVFVDSGGSWWAGVVDIKDSCPSYQEKWEMLPVEDRELVKKIKGEDVERGVHNSGGGISVLYDKKSENSLILSFVTFYNTMSNVTWIYNEKDNSLYGWAGCDFAGFILPAGKKTYSETLFLGFYQSPFSALEDYATVSARFMKVKLPDSVPMGWCSWYAYRLNVSEEKVLKNAYLIRKFFSGYKFSYIQVDHGWQYKDICGHWTETNERFPHGIGWLAEELKKMGFKLGLWIGLFTVLESSPLFKEHPEWLIRDINGNPRPMAFHWSWPPHERVYCLDPTHPGAKKFIEDTLNYLKKAGVKYWKVDFTWRIAIRDRDAVYYDRRYIKGAQIYRKGLSIIAETLKNDYIYWCSNPTNLGFGLGSTTMVADDIDNTGFRTDDDLKEAIGYGKKPVKLEDFRRKATTIISRYFLHKKLTLINPDVVEVGRPGDYEEAKIRVSVVALCGGQVFLGDDLTTLKKKDWDLLSKCIPPLGESARPVDLFENTYPKSYPQIWHLNIKKNWGMWDIAGLFNLTKEKKDITVNFVNLGLKKDKNYLVFEFWEKKLIGIAKNSVKINMKPVTTKLLVIKEYPAHPIVLSTDMHFSQGAVELKEVYFFDSKNIMKGIAKRQKGAKGNLFIFVPDGYEVIKKKNIKEVGKGLYKLSLIFDRPAVKWEVKFKKNNKD